MEHIEQGIYEANEISISLTEPTGEEKVWIKRGKNRYNKNDTPKLNMFVNVPNSKIDEIATSRSTYMSIEPNKTYTISKIAGKCFRVATTSSEPKKDTSIISTVANHEGTSITITTESNAKYLFINYYSSANGDTESEEVLRSSLQVVEGSEVLSFEEYVDTEINMKENGEFKEISSVAVGTVAPDRGEKLWIKRGKNRFNKSTGIVTGKYISNTGELVDYNEAWYQEEYIQVSANQQYIISSTQGTFRVAFYTKNLQFISRINTENDSLVFTTPDNCKYLRVSGRVCTPSQLDTLQLEKGNEATTYEAYMETTLNVKENGFNEILNIDEVNKSSYKKCALMVGCSMTIQNTTGTNLSYNTIKYDYGGFCTNAKDRFVIPKGIKKVRLTANIHWQASRESGYYLIMINQYNANGNQKEGLGNPQCLTPATSSGMADFHTSQNISSAAIEVEEGDYFVTRVYHCTGSDIIFENEAFKKLTWFNIEKVE